ncbi:Na+/H+ antiporter [Emticicia sp. C21]|uniref:Na+/H+ antiporter n=1 Tax=Emticicia sp. C21 TaxID=2302915 RepID=UPI000E34F9BD|nr:Na+/H+ antiporter [Emticicia sp. C21]RFS13649.1 Na+/H+ antiporter [Emticicia sp. C21]
MENYSIVLIILGLMIVLSAIATRIRIPYPILLVTAGIAIGFIPGVPTIILNPEIVFLIFLPPLLFDAAFNISYKELRNNWATISTLAFPLVFFTTTAIAVVTHYLIPAMSWAMSFALGAILSPPDAVAATNVTKGLGLSHRTITILEGESLVNDASGLIAFRFAVAAIVGTSFDLLKAPFQFLMVVAGGIFVGIVIGRILAFFLLRVYNNSLIGISAIALTPFIAYLVAEELHVSGVLAVVVLGVTLALFSGKLISKGTKEQNKSFWDVIIFLLNGLVFILIGLQYPLVIKNINHEDILQFIGYSFLISLIMLVLRIFWIFGHSKNLKKAIDKRTQNIMGFRTGLYADEKIDWKNSLIIGWAGMRGIVSLASALSLPFLLSDGTPFIQRDAIIFISVVVVLITLIIQGLTLPLLVRALDRSEQMKVKQKI